MEIAEFSSIIPLFVSNIIIFTRVRLIHSRLVLKCKRYRISRATARTFFDSLYPTGRYIYSRCSQRTQCKRYELQCTQKRVPLNTDCINNEGPDNKNKVGTIRPISKDKHCYFSLQIVCSKEDDKWYLCHSKDSRGIYG